MNLRIVCVVVGFLSLALSLAAQSAGSSLASAQVPPPLIQFSNVATDEGGNTLSGVVSITFSLYTAQQGGEALWTETQNNVQLDSTGHYSVQLGITKPNGVPTTLFTTGEARWLGVQIAEQPEQPRVLLLSVPYALKAGDAATIGGLPPSAFVLAAPQNGTASAFTTESVTQQTVSPETATDVTTTGGTANYLPIFNGASTIIDSLLSQSGSTLNVKGGANVQGLFTLPATGTATSSGGKVSQGQEFVASSYNSGTAAAVNETFELRAESAGNDTTSPSATLSVLFGSGTTAPAETGLKIAGNGQFTFATGQTFPGTGTITGITTASGSGLTGGSTKGTLSLGLKTCSANQVLEYVSGAWTCSNAGTGTVTSVGSGTGLTGGPITGSGTLSIDTTKVPQLGAANTFTGNQAVNGTLTASSTSAVGSGVVGNTSSATGYGVEGNVTATTGSSAGVYGTTASPTGRGVLGQSNAAGGTGVYGASTNGIGVEGYDSATSGNAAGVLGSTSSPTGIGVIGEQGSTGSSSITAGAGVSGITLSPTSYGVAGYQYATTGGTAGVYGQTMSPTGYGVYGSGAGTGVGGASTTGVGVSGTGPFAGVNGTGTEAGSFGVIGSGVNGVEGTGSNIGVLGQTSSAGSYVYGVGGYANAATGYNSGVYGYAGSPTGYGVYGNGGTGVVGVSTGPGSTADGTSSPGGSFTGGPALPGSGLSGNAGVVGAGGAPDPNTFGVRGGPGVEGYGGPGGLADGLGGYFTGGSAAGALGDGVDAIGGSGDGIYGQAGSGYTTTFAGSFQGNVQIFGSISYDADDFKIDHPLDPANKYLVHSSVESSEMKNIYDGSVTTDSQGQATIQLPEWFQILNTDFRYQLTVIGQFAQAIVAHEIENNQFEIRTSVPNVKVSWQVTGVRQDAYAKAHPLVVEEKKEARLKGFYIHPELYDAPNEKQIEWARRPQTMKRIQAMRAKQQLATKATAQPVPPQP